jgi:hypothetical protein
MMTISNFRNCDRLSTTRWRQHHKRSLLLLRGSEPLFTSGLWAQSANRRLASKEITGPVLAKIEYP